MLAIKNKLIIFICMLIIAKEDVVSNPISIVNQQNLIVNSTEEYYYIYTSSNLIKLKKIDGTKEILQLNEFVELSFSSFLVINEASTPSNTYIISGCNKAKIVNSNSIEKEVFLSTECPTSFIGYIKEPEYIGPKPKMVNEICDFEINEVILYGKSSKKFFFLFMNNGNFFQVPINNEFEDKISCKRIETAYYLCGIIIENKAKALIIKYLNLHEGCSMTIFPNQQPNNLDNKLSYHKNIEIYDTPINENRKMICAIKRDANIIECLFLTARSKCSLNMDIFNLEYQDYYENISNTITPLQSGFVNDCVLTNKIFKNESLFCCGGTDSIECARLEINNNILVIKNTFKLTQEGNNDELYIFSDGNTYIDIFFQNKLNDNYEIKEYSIYNPTCNEMRFEMFFLESIVILNLSEVFERKTNTKYYVEFENLPDDFGDLRMNEQKINEENEKILLEENENYILDFVSTNNNTVEQFKILYSISIDETFSAQCGIVLTISTCYDSCQECTKFKEYANFTNHYCVENKCKSGYYPSPIIPTSCYKQDEKIFNLYFDTQENGFKLCDSSCAFCNGANSDNCLSCYSINEKSEFAFLANNKCLNQCPEGTYPSIQLGDYYLCEECYEKCQSCEQGPVYDNSNKLINMSCLLCKEERDPNDENKLIPKNILYEGNCYPIKTYTEDKIIFYYASEFDTELTEKTCLDFDQMIIQGTYKCIPKQENSFYVSNNDGNTGVVKMCYKSCKTCNNIKIDDNMNCIECIDGFLKMGGTNNCYNKSIIGFYIKDNELYPCEENCETCSDSKTIIDGIISNNCLTCDKTKNLYLLPDLNNCEPESLKENGYYLKSIDGDDNKKVFYKCYDSCSLCNEGEKFITFTNSYIHNCVKCKDNYYPEKWEERNCYSEQTIPEGYFLKKSDTVFIWEECYERCSKCSSRGTAEKMLCISCKTNYIEEEYNKPVNFALFKGNCKMTCLDDLFLTKVLDCVATCPFGTYKYLPNKTCVDECPSNFKINEENTECIFFEFKNETSLYDFEEVIFSNISNFVDAFNVIKGNNFLAQVIASKDIDPIEQIKIGISGLDLGDCIEVLKAEYNIPESEDLIVVEKEIKKYMNNKGSIELGKDVKIDIADNRGNILDMSHCENDIVIMKYFGDLNTIKIDQAKEYAEKGIDVFNPLDDFFNEKCKYYGIDKDITLKDKRDDIYQDVDFCGDNCKNGGFDYSLNIVNCSCDSNSLQDNIENIDKDKDEKVSLNNVAKSFKSGLLSFNYDVIKCFNLVIDPSILKKNIGFYSNIIFIGIQIGMIGYFFNKKLTPIKTFMLTFESKIIKEDNPTPPKILRNNKKDKKSSKTLNLRNNLRFSKTNVDNILNNQEENIIIMGNLKNKKNIDNLKHRLNNENNMKKKKLKKIVRKKNKLNTHSQQKSQLNLKNSNNRINNINKISTLITSEELFINNDIIIKNRNKRNYVVKKQKINNNDNDELKIKENEKISYESIKSEESGIKNSENKETLKIEEKENNEIYISPDEKYEKMEYDEAINNDKRSFFEMYKFLIFEQQNFLNTFFSEIYLELRAIKISFMIFGYQIGFFLNSFFYSDEYISDTYHNNGILNFVSSLPKSIYSFLVTIILSSLLKMLSNSKKQLSKIINTKKNEQEFIEAIEIELNKLKKKLIAYYIIVFILGLFFNYYASAFCAVYINSRMFWFLGCIESLVLDFITPFAICFCLAGLRYIGIRKKSKFIYKISSLLNSIL